MKSPVLFVAIITALLQICTPPPSTDLFTYRDEGIQIDLKADHMLNSWDGEAHTVKLAIYQLSDNSVFKDKVSNREGIGELLKVTKFDPSVVSFRQEIIKPNDSRLIILDRAEGAKWVGIIAGYFTQDQLPPFKCIQIPTKAKRKNIIRRIGEYTGLMTPFDNRYVPPMLIQLVLTPQTMYETSIYQ